MRLVGMCVAALMLVGCGAEDAADDVREAVDPVAQAADKMAASGGARVDGDMIVRTAGMAIPMRMDGVVSFEDHEAEFVMDYAEGGIPGATARQMQVARREADFPVRMVMRTDETYVSTPSIVARARRTACAGSRSTSRRPTSRASSTCPASTRCPRSIPRRCCGS